MQSLVLRRTNVSSWLKVLGVLLFAVATAVSARLSVLLPFSPVPLTFQVLVVVLSGFALGARGGFLAQMLYLQAILLGAPLSASGLGGPAAFLTPSAGYLIAFPVSATLAGWLSHRSEAHRVLWRALGGMAAVAAIYLGGMLWLSGIVGGLKAAWTMGVLPFIGVDALKVIVATAAFSIKRR
jgi:biotin transport system substrate-specific component